MNWEIQHNLKTGITKVTTIGDFDVQLMNGMIKAIISAVEKYNSTGLLLDHSKATINISIAETFERPKQFDNMGIPRNSKIALVISKEQSEAFKFFETVLVNRGFQIKIFQTDVEAEKWLQISNI